MHAKPYNQSSSSSEQQHAKNGRMRKRRGGEGAGDAGRAKKRERESERNRIGRTNYLVVKWPECSVFPVMTEGKELRAYEYNKLN